MVVNAIAHSVSSTVLTASEARKRGLWNHFNSNNLTRRTLLPASPLVLPMACLTQAGVTMDRLAWALWTLSTANAAMSVV